MGMSKDVYVCSSIDTARPQVTHLIVLDIAVNLARFVVASNEPPFVWVQNLHSHDVRNHRYTVLAPAPFQCV